MDDSEPTEAEREAAQFEDGGRLFAERVERNPWTHELRAAMAKAERTGDRRPIDDFARRFKEDDGRYLPVGDGPGRIDIASQFRSPRLALGWSAFELVLVAGSHRLAGPFIGVYSWRWG
jgi:hypothetical protein